MNTLESVRCLKKDVEVCSMFDKMVFDHKLESLRRQFFNISPFRSGIVFRFDLQLINFGCKSKVDNTVCFVLVIVKKS